MFILKWLSGFPTVLRIKSELLPNAIKLHEAWHVYIIPFSTPHTTLLSSWIWSSGPSGDSRIFKKIYWLLLVFLLPFSALSFSPPFFPFYLLPPSFLPFPLIIFFQQIFLQTFMFHIRDIKDCRMDKMENADFVYLTILYNEQEYF